jgi:hypothetical protein
MALFFWAVTDEWIVAAFVIGWGVIAVLIPTARELRRLPKDSAPYTRIDQPLPLQANAIVTVRRSAPNSQGLWKLFIVLFAGAIMVMSGEGGMGNAYRQFPGAEKRPQLANLLVFAWAAYVLLTHLFEAVRELSDIAGEFRLSRSAALARGRVLRNRTGTIEYEFRDCSNDLRRGRGADYSHSTFEGMPVDIVFDPNRPQINLPVTALIFHTIDR